MSIQGQQNINIGAAGNATGSDTLYTAVNKIQNNFTTLFTTSSPYNSFVPVKYSNALAEQFDPGANGIGIYTNINSGVVSFINTGVTSITAGSGILVTNSKGDITISSTSSSGSSGIGSIGISSNTITITNTPLITSGVINIDLPKVPVSSSFIAGSYTAATVTVDDYGRVVGISNSSSFGTVTRVAVAAVGAGLSITGGPITGSGTISITNTGVTQLNAGPGISLNSNTGAITISTTGGGGTVSKVSIASNTLTVSGGPITSIGTLSVDIPSDPTFNGNTTVNKLAITNTGSNVLYVAGSANIAYDLYIGGNLYVPNIISTNSTTLDVTDPLLYLSATAPYPYNYEIGFYSHFQTGSGTGYQHTGLVRNHTNNQWYLFSNAAEPAGGTVDLANANLKLDSLILGNVTSLNANLGNLATANYITIATNANIGGVTNVTGNISSGNANLGNLATSNYFAGVLTTNAQPNITSVGTLASLAVTANITSGNSNVTTLLTTANANVTTLLTANVANANLINATGNIVGANINANTLLTAPQLVISTVTPATLYNGSIAMDAANNRLVIVYGSTLHYIHTTSS